MNKIHYHLVKTERPAIEENRIAESTRFHTTLDELFSIMQDVAGDYADKNDAGFIIPVQFKAVDDPRVILIDGFVRRKASNTAYCTMIAVDVDDHLTMEYMAEKYREYSWIMYTSYNNGKNGVERFRMIFEIESPVTADEWTEMRPAILHWLGGKSVIDQTCLYITHGFYLPSFHPDNAMDFVLERNFGKAVDMQMFTNGSSIAKLVKATTNANGSRPSGGTYVGKPSNATDEERLMVLDELRDATIDSYSVWWQVVQALKSEGYDLNDVLYAMCDNPNHVSPNTGIKDQAMCEKTFNQVEVQDSGMGKLVTAIRSGGNADFCMLSGYSSVQPTVKMAKLGEIKKNMMDELNSLRGGM